MPMTAPVNAGGNISCVDTWGGTGGSGGGRGGGGRAGGGVADAPGG